MAFSPGKERNLTMQGFSCSSESGTREIEPWLRFTPALSMIWILVGTIVAIPLVLWIFSIISGLGATSSRHPFDHIYNRWIRRYTQTSELPINPRPRRFAMFLAALWAAVTGTLFLFDFMLAGYISGFLLTAAAVLVATTHFCLGSWIYRNIERFRTKAG